MDTVRITTLMEYVYGFQYKNIIIVVDEKNSSINKVYYRLTSRVWIQSMWCVRNLVVWNENKTEWPMKNEQKSFEHSFYHHILKTFQLVFIIITSNFSSGNIIRSSLHYKRIGIISRIKSLEKWRWNHRNGLTIQKCSSQWKR